jgi:hypothetical protein
MNRVLCFVMLASVCLADIPPPPPPVKGAPVKSAPTTLVIRSEEGSTYSLRIPADLLQKVGATDGRMRAAVAGALLSLAVVLAGIVLVRWKRSAVLGVVVLALAGAGAIVADIVLPRPRQPPPADPAVARTLRDIRSAQHGAGPVSEPVVVQIVPAGEPLTLIVPKH